MIVYKICEDFLSDFSSTIELCTFFVCTLGLSDWKPFILVFLGFERWFGLVIDTLLIGLQYASQSLIGFIFWMMYVKLLGSSTLMKIQNFFGENTKKNQVSAIFHYAALIPEVVDNLQLVHCENFFFPSNLSLINFFSSSSQS